MRGDDENIMFCEFQNERLKPDEEAGDPFEVNLQSSPISSSPVDVEFAWLHGC